MPRPETRSCNAAAAFPVGLRRALLAPAPIPRPENLSFETTEEGATRPELDFLGDSNHRKMPQPGTTATVLASMGIGETA